MSNVKTKRPAWRWVYVGITGPYQVISPEGHVAVTLHGVRDDPNKDIPLVAKITKLCERHQRAQR